MSLLTQYLKVTEVFKKIWTYLERLISFFYLYKYLLWVDKTNAKSSDNYITHNSDYSSYKMYLIYWAKHISLSKKNLKIIYLYKACSLYTILKQISISSSKSKIFKSSGYKF